MNRDEFYIDDISHQIEFIMDTVPKITKSELIASDLYQNALIRSLEIIGEASKRLSAEFTEKYPDIPVRDMARTRDKMIHGYEEIDFDLLWRILSEDIPQLSIQISALLK